jgi:hypothetical protein
LGFAEILMNLAWPRSMQWFWVHPRDEFTVRQAYHSL